MTPLREGDLIAFQAKPSVIRVFAKKTGTWFVGKIEKDWDDDGVWRLRMSPYFAIRFKDAPQPDDPGDCLIGCPHNIIIKDRFDDDQQTFNLQQPQKHMPPAGETLIAECETMVVALSSRQRDVDMFDHLCTAHPR